MSERSSSTIAMGSRPWTIRRATHTAVDRRAAVQTRPSARGRYDSWPMACFSAARVMSSSGIVPYRQWPSTQM